MRTVSYLVVHTAADPREGGSHDTPARDIRRWHLARGWTDIGYHYVVRRSGGVEQGRPEWRVGAHVEGLNTKSIGICLSGHGDKAPMTQEQENALLDLLVKLMKRYNIPAHRVIGHKEVNKLVEAKVVPARYKTTKTCPGKYVDMSVIRRKLTERTENAEEK